MSCTLILFFYEFKLNHDTIEAVRNINKAYVDNTVKDWTLQRWFKKFWSADMNLENEQYGHSAPLLWNNELQTLVDCDPCQTVKDMTEQLGIHFLSALCHLHALGKAKKLDEWVPHKLAEQNLKNLLYLCTSVLI